MFFNAWNNIIHISSYLIFLFLNNCTLTYDNDVIFWTGCCTSRMPIINRSSKVEYLFSQKSSHKTYVAVENLIDSEFKITRLAPIVFSKYYTNI